MQLIRFNKACAHLRLTDIQGCPYAVCLCEKKLKVSPDIVACQFAISCSEYRVSGGDPMVSSQRSPKIQSDLGGLLGKKS